MKKKINKQIFLDELPHKQGKGFTINQSVIDWLNCEGHKVNFIYEDIKGTLTIRKYDSITKKLTVLYNEKDFFISTNAFKRCELSIVLGLCTTEFRYEIGQRITDESRDITIIDRKKKERYKKNGEKCYDRYYRYICNKCGFDCGKHWSTKDKIYKDEHWILESAIKTNGVGCSCCCFSPQIVVENINSIYKTDPWMIPIVGEECAKTHTSRSGEYIYPICPDCGRVKKTKRKINSIFNKESMGCKFCGDGVSKPNKIMTSILMQLNIDFESEYSPEWIGLRRYDFYIPYMKLIIEMDGGLGHGNGVHNKGKLTIE